MNVNDTKEHSAALYAAPKKGKNVMRFDQTLTTFVAKDLTHGNIPMLLGEPGIGKSSWVEGLARAMHTKCFTLACNQLADKADLTGARLVPVTVDKKVPDGNGGFTVEQKQTYKQVFYPHAVIHDAIEYAKANPRETPILFLDELNRTTPDVTSEALSIPTLRKIGSAELPVNLKVVTAGNDKGNVTVLDEASISRFVLYHVEPDKDTFVQVNPELNVYVKAVLDKNPNLLFCKRIVAVTQQDDDQNGNGGKNGNDLQAIEEIIGDVEDMSQLTTPRTITAVSRWLNQFDNNELITLMNTPGSEETQNILQEGIEGHVGQTNFAALLLAEIANNVMNTNNQSNALSVPKPGAYDAMKACADMTSLNAFVQSMTDADKSGCIVYALWEKADNANFLKALAGATSTLTGPDMLLVGQLATTDQLDPENVAALMATKTALTAMLSVWFGN